MSKLSWEEPCCILEQAEAIVSARSPYAERPEWAVTRQHHALWAEPIIYALQSLPAGSNVLDVGPGYGALAVAATLLGHQVTALELFLDPLEWQGIRWVRGNVCDPSAIPAVPASECTIGGLPYDCAIMAEVLEHLTTDPAEALANVSRALKLGGLFLGSTPTPGIWPGLEPVEGDLPKWRPGDVPEDRHVRLYSPEEVAALLRGAGLGVEEQEFIGTPSYRHMWRARKHDWDPARLCTSPWETEDF